jgi:hypothetical protein
MNKFDALETFDIRNKILHVSILFCLFQVIRGDRICSVYRTADPQASSIALMDSWAAKVPNGNGKDRSRFLGLM